MQLRHINIRALIAEAGGDPWAIEHSLHAGRPAQIAELAEAFHAAGRCTAEANAAFEEARRRFEASWNRENGEHPINDSAEVQRVTAALGVQSLPAGDGFGSVRFRAEVPNSDGINPHDHSYYYHRGSEALRSMADIASGHGDALASDGMLAQPRH